MSGVGVLADLRGVVRIAKAASVGVTGNGPRIDRAEAAIGAVCELIDASADFLHCESTGYHATAIVTPRNRLRAALARVQGGGA